jgi:hypothetical protein
MSEKPCSIPDGGTLFLHWYNAYRSAATFLQG